MATVEEFLVGIGVDPRSVREFLKDVDRIKDRAEQGTVGITVTSNAGVVLATTTAGTVALGSAATATTLAFQAGIRGVTAALAELKIGLLAVTAIAGVGFGLAVGAAASESLNLARANVILGQSAEELQQTRTALREIAVTANLSFQTVSGALFDIASSGRRGADALLAVEAAALVAGPAGVDIATVYSALDAIMKNFGGTALEAADSLVQIGDAAVASIDEVAAGVSRFGPLAAALGIPLSQVGGAFAVLTGNQIEAAIATTQIRSAISALIKPSKEAEVELKKVGVTFGATSFRAQDLVEKFQQLARAGDDVDIARIFPQEAISGALTLIQNIDNLVVQTDKIAGAAGRAQDAFNSFRLEVGVQLGELITAITNFATVFGRDLLDALQPIIVFLKDFINENQELLGILAKVVVAFGALIATITIANFIVGQIAASFKLLVALKGVLLALLGRETIATAANTTAQITNAAARTGVLTAIRIGLFQRLINLLNRETGVIVRNAAAWLLNAVRRAALGIAAVVKAIGLAVIAIVSETAALRINTAAYGINIVSRGRLAAVTAALTAVLNTNVAAVSLGAVTLGVFAAAAAGFAFGTFINEVFGISDAFAEVAASAEKARIALKENILPESTLALLKSSAGALDQFNRLLRENTQLTQQRAAAFALDDRQLIGFLQSLQKDGKITVEQERDLAEAVERVDSAMRSATTTARELGDATRSVASARSKLKEIEKELAKVIEDVTKRTIRARQGEEAVSIRTAQTATARRVELLAQAAKEEFAIARKLELDITRLREAGETVSPVQASNLAEQRQKITRLQRLIIDEQQNFVEDLNRIARQRIQNDTQNSQRLIQIARQTADALIAEEERIVRDSTSAIRRLQQERNSQISSTAAFLDNLRQAAIQRVDPALAELRRFEVAAREALLGAAPEQARRGIAAITTEINRLIAPTRDEVRALNDLREAEKRIEEADTQDRAVDALKERSRLLNRVSELEELRNQRQEVGRRLQEEFNELVAQAEQREKDRAAAIEVEQARIVTAQETILRLREAVRLKEESITKELNKQLTAFNQIVDANRRLAAARVGRAIDAPLIGDIRARRGEDFGDAAGLLDDLEEAVQNAQSQVTRLERARILTEQDVGIEKLATTTDLAFESITTAIAERQRQQQEIQTAVEESQVLQSELERITGEAVDAELELTTTVQQVLVEQGKFGDAVASGFEVTNEQLQELNRQTRANTRRTDALARAIASIRIADPETERRAVGRQ